MSLLFVRQTYWNIPCTYRNLAAGIACLKKAFNAPGRGTPTAAGPSFSSPTAAWREYKVGTYGGRQVLLLLEISQGQADFLPILQPGLKKMLLHERQHNFRTDEGRRKHTYLLFGYTPFRSPAYQHYQETRSLTDKSELLKEHLSYHLIRLAIRLDWSKKAVLGVENVRIRKEKNLRLGGQYQASFDLEFTTNLFIPEFLGLGRGASHGLGVVRPRRGARG